MTDLFEVIKWIIGGLTAIGGLIAVGLAYINGKKSQKNAQIKETARELQKLQQEASNPRPSSNDDRSSMRDGSF